MKICKMCGKSVTKLARAHIIPKAFFKYTEAKSKKLGNGSTMIMITNSKGQSPMRRIRDGWYDPDLICPECEKILAIYDDYAIKVFLKNENSQVSMIKDGQIVGWEIKEYDYKKLKLFVVSVLWRIGVSNLPQFKKIKISKKVLEEAKNLTLNNDQGNRNEFSFIVARFGDEFGKAFMADPHREYIGNLFGHLKSFRIYLGAGYVIFIKTSTAPFPKGSEELSAIEGHPLEIVRKTDFPVSKEYEVSKIVNRQANKKLNILRAR